MIMCVLLEMSDVVVWDAFLKKQTSSEADICAGASALPVSYLELVNCSPVNNFDFDFSHVTMLLER